MVNTLVNFINILIDKVNSITPENLIYDTSLVLVVSITLIIQNTRKNANGKFSIWFYYIIGTFFHELMHAIASKILNGKPIKFWVFPEKVDGGWILGYVTSKNIRWYNRIPIAMAPLFLLPLAFWVEINFFKYFGLNYWSAFLYYFVLINLITSSIPSDVDFKHAFKGLFQFFIFFIFFFIIYMGIINYA